MTTKIGNVVVIQPEQDTKCVRCGKSEECRDIKRDGKQVCFDCATEKERDDYCAWLFGDKTAN